jgi:hypothetical protein
MPVKLTMISKALDMQYLMASSQSSAGWFCNFNCTHQLKINMLMSIPQVSLEGICSMDAENVTFHHGLDIQKILKLEEK